MIEKLYDLIKRTKKIKYQEIKPRRTKRNVDAIEPEKKQIIWKVNGRAIR